MAASSASLHEDPAILSAETKDTHRAIVSLMEELEAIDWYQQRAEGCEDQDLRAILLHNKNEEIEHAMMTLEWIRRRNPHFGENMETYLFSEGPILEVEEKTKEGGAGGGEGAASRPPSGKSAPGSGRAPSIRGGGGQDGSLGIGSLKDV